MAHLAGHPYVSCAYYDSWAVAVVADSRIEPITDDAARTHVWELFRATPPPLGFDPGAIGVPGWDGPPRRGSWWPGWTRGGCRSAGSGPASGWSCGRGGPPGSRSRRVAWAAARPRWVALADTGPKPAEYLLHALAACVTTCARVLGGSRGRPSGYTRRSPAQGERP